MLVLALGYAQASKPAGRCMEFTLWGVRGSIANPNQINRYYGANTACVEVRTSAGDMLIFDAGTGINSLSDTLPESGKCNLFISHAHSDHVLGLSFFKPMFLPGWTTNVYIPKSHPDLLERWFDGTSFPVSFSSLRGKINVNLIEPGARLEIQGNSGTIFIDAIATNHPGDCIAYKVFADDEVFLYSGDHEIISEETVQAQTAQLLDGVTTAVVDASYSRSNPMRGWGHSAWEDWVDAARAAGINSLVLTHHAQNRADAELDELQQALDEKYNGPGFTAIVAKEGMKFFVRPCCLAPSLPSSWLHDFTLSISKYKEESAVLDRILAKTRELTQAEAGTIYLKEGAELVFAYTHNDFLFPQSKSYKYAYSSVRIPVTSSSIAGYVAVTDSPLNLQDVHALPPDVPYNFNDSFDKKTGYYTKSMLTVPLLSKSRRLLGVLQLINSLVPGTRTPQPFSTEMADSVLMLAREASTYLEISDNIKENIYRLLRIAVLRDPTETGAHAERVGAIAAEVYQAWAERQDESADMIRFYRSKLRLAAMLHDVGKVGIPDVVLKKPDKLTDEEFGIMRGHTTLGADLFANDPEDISELAYDIAMHHHQKWNGAGYPAFGGGLKLAGDDIPLAARITAIADVFDALVSPRCYKQPWSFEKAMNLLQEEAGEHFDPALVDCFMEIKDTIPLIYERFPDIELRQDASVPTLAAGK